MDNDPIDDFLIANQNKKRTVGEVYLWWERQRFKFNKICFVVTSLGMLVIFLIKEKLFQIAGPIVLVVFMFALLGNLFYFLGWFIELFTSRNEQVGPILFIVITAITCLFLLISLFSLLLDFPRPIF